ncbi:MAG: PhoH family protein [Hyphomonadaceae bacterium]|nr:PhoH family protein [Hyphomonadaceae bacterium]
MSHCDPTQVRQSRTISVQDRVALHFLAAPNGAARALEAAVRPYRLAVRGSEEGLRLDGDATAVALASDAVERLLAAMHGGGLDDEKVRGVVGEAIEYVLKHDLAFRLVGLSQALRPMSLSQVAFMNTLLHAERALVFGIGPTGTGKTHIAIAAGLNALALGKVKTLVATRPHVMMEGEVITAAIRAETALDDQLAPIEDELHALLGPEEVKRLKEREQLEVLPLGRMRGRTFNDAYIVIDEAQDLTIRKMRMAVTRLGRGSRMVITGDPSHIDLHEEEPSGLPHILAMIAGTDLALVHEFDRPNIIRNDVVARLEALYAGEGTGAATRVA